MYELIGICLTLAALLALNACASTLTALLWHFVAPNTSGWTAATRARVLFGLRACPSALAAFFAFAFVIPAYVLHEPRHTNEVVGAKLLLLALASAAGVALALKRVVSTWWATQRLKRDWLRHAEVVAVEGVNAPAYRIRHRFPVIAVVGVVRPRLFIAAQIFDALRTEELAAALAHEQGHVAARDNFKHALLQATQDALLLAFLGRPLTRAWQRDSEVAADEYAACRSPEAALNLASAIIKISRLIPSGVKPTLPAGAHLLGEDEDGLAQRVRNLLRLAAPGNRAHRPARGYASALLVWAFCLSLCAAGVFAFSCSNVLTATHNAIEQVVAGLK